MNELAPAGNPKIVTQHFAEVFPRGVKVFVGLFWLPNIFELEVCCGDVSVRVTASKKSLVDLFSEIPAKLAMF